MSRAEFLGGQFVQADFFRGPICRGPIWQRADSSSSPIQDEFNKLGFKIVLKNRWNISRHNSGGIGIAYKNKFEKHVKVVASESKHVLWVKINGNSCIFNKDIYVGCVYIPPQNSEYANANDIDMLLENMINLNANENLFLLCGNFNAHTNILNDILSLDEHIHDSV